MLPQGSATQDENRWDDGSNDLRRGKRGRLCLVPRARKGV